MVLFVCNVWRHDLSGESCLQLICDALVLQAHGWMAVIGLGFLIPLGIVIAKVFSGSGAWRIMFWVHIVLQACSLKSCLQHNMPAVCKHANCLASWPCHSACLIDSSTGCQIGHYHEPVSCQRATARARIKTCLLCLPANGHEDMRMRSAGAWGADGHCGGRAGFTAGIGQ